eukprot:maker-scaffold_5-snap-gene-8.6-mRNA-1 protein AED:0.26 eAED:0.26 QI:22/1/1/1/1/1/2/62/381
MSESDEKENEEIPYTCFYLDGQRETSDWLKGSGDVVILYPNKDIFVGRVNKEKKKEGEGVYLHFKAVADEPDEIADFKFEEAVQYFEKHLLSQLTENQKVKFDEYYPVHEEKLLANYFTYVFRGTYCSGKREGVGSLFSNGGLQYIGNWKENKKFGKGTLLFPNGHIFSGDFIDGNPEGKGVYDFDPIPQKILGIWRNGRLIEGKWIDETFPDEPRIFIGTFKDLGTGVEMGEIGVQYFHDGRYVIRDPLNPFPNTRMLPKGFNFAKLRENSFTAPGYDVADEELIEFEAETKLASEINEALHFSELFGLCDKNESGQVSFGELQDAMEKYRDKFPKEFVDGDVNRVGVLARFKVGDINRDQLLTFEEFELMMKELDVKEE